MTEIKPLKLCRICKESKEASEFYTGRKECKQCKIDYQLNRYHDLKDGKRDMISWHDNSKLRMIPRDIEHVNEDRKDTHVVQVEEQELRNTTDSDGLFATKLLYMVFTITVLYYVLSACALRFQG